MFEFCQLDAASDAASKSFPEIWMLSFVERSHIQSIKRLPSFCAWCIRYNVFPSTNSTRGSAQITKQNIVLLYVDGPGLRV